MASTVHRLMAINAYTGLMGSGKLASVGDSVTFKSASIDAVFSALSTDSRFKSISNPSLRVKSGSSARFSVGSDVPVLGAVQFDKAGNPIQSVEYIGDKLVSPACDVCHQNKKGAEAPFFVGLFFIQQTT